MKNLSKNSKKAFSLVEISIVVLIVGLLIAGISKASDMIFDANLKTGRSLTKGAKVNRMPSLSLWLEATLTESLLDKERYDATAISIWRDVNPQVSSKLIFKKTGTPKYVEFGQDNMPAIGFTSSTVDTDFFLPYNSETSSTVASYSSTQIFSNANATIFMVLKPKSAVTELLNFCPYDSTATPAFACALGKEIKLALDVNGNVKFSFISGSATTADILSTSSQSKKNLIIVSALKDSAGNKLFINGETAGTAIANANTATTSFSGTFRIGGVAGVEIYEIIVFSSALSYSDRQNVETYLGKKFSIPVVKTNI